MDIGKKANLEVYYPSTEFWVEWRKNKAALRDQGMFPKKINNKWYVIKELKNESGESRSV